MRHGRFLTVAGEVVDEVLVVSMPAGRSYTGLDQVEIFCHGGCHVVRVILEEILAAGARPAEPGEFTKLAFLNGRIDLSKAEAVAEIVAASTQTSYRAGLDHLVGTYSDYVDELRNRLLAALSDIEASIDFGEEETDSVDFQQLRSQLGEIGWQVDRLAATYRGGRIIREGYRIAVWGRPNAGKSSLFNLLLEQERALVDPTAGTTRDYLSEWIDLDGIAVNLTDTAGFRTSADRVEQKGQVKARNIVDRADLVLWMTDITAPDWQADLAKDLKGLVDKNKLLIGNKIDLVPAFRGSVPEDLFPLSCLTREGLNELRVALVTFINGSLPDLTAGQVVTSARHRRCLDLASESIGRAVSALEGGESPEIIALEVRQAADSLGEITGKVYTEEILGEIFSRFCIGK